MWKVQGVKLHVGAMLQAMEGYDFATATQRLYSFWQVRPSLLLHSPVRPRVLPASPLSGAPFDAPSLLLLVCCVDAHS